jgi:hypothetical protein
MKKILYIVAILLIAVTPVMAVDLPPLFQGTSVSYVESTPYIGNVVAGDTTIVSVDSGKKFVLFRYDFKSEGDLTDLTQLQVGVTNVYAIKNALADNVYGENISIIPYVGADGEDVIINTPGAVYYNIAGTIISVGP